MTSLFFSYPDNMVIDVGKAMSMSVQESILPEKIALSDMTIKANDIGIYGGRYVPKGVRASNWAYVLIYKDHAMETNLDLPLLAYRHPLGGRQVFVFDGYHRIYKAISVGLEHLRACVLSYGQVQNCVVRWGEVPMLVRGNGDALE